MLVEITWIDGTSDRINLDESSMNQLKDKLSQSFNLNLTVENVFYNFNHARRVVCEKQKPSMEE